jgi:hypothetical protein
MAMRNGLGARVEGIWRDFALFGDIEQNIVDIAMRCKAKPIPKSLHAALADVPRFERNSHAFINCAV